MKEKWKAIKDFEDYEVSDMGTVRRRLPGKSTKVGRILKPMPDKNGYLTIRVTKAGEEKKHTLKVHRLVAQAFIPNPDNLPEVNHTGANDDNRAKKLEWISRPDHCSDISRRHQIGSGVCFKKSINKWCARKTVATNKRLWLGYFETKEQALKAVERFSK